MNSAEKKAPEPSMDDIISSIRNIISDDAQETVPAHEAPAVEAPAPAIVQLTENQIAEPAIEQVSSVSATPDAMATNPVPEPVAVQSTPDLEIANEIDAVPGLMTALETSISAEAPAPVAPKLTVSEPLPPATQVEAAPINDGMAPTAPTIMPATSEAIATPAPQAAITPELAASELNAQVPAASLSLDEPAAIIEDDIAFVSPEVSQNSLADTSLAPDALSTTLTNDPVEEMMQSVNADQAESDLVSNEVDPDRILEGMVPAAAAEVTSSVLVEAVPVVQEPVIASAPDVEAIADEAPVVLDASQVTPEDAMAITAVAAATTQALSGTSPSEPVADTTKSKTGNSLEDSVKAMLKPMIKEWLDDNMPRILEGAIKDEVELPDNDKT